MTLVSSPALRPSPPYGCRKRASGQGHALPGRFVGLDRHALASGYGCLRATDEEASGGDSVKGSSRFRDTKATTQKSVSRLSQLSPIPTRGEHNTCKSASTYASQNLPYTYGVASRPAFRYPRRHVHHADHTLRRIQIVRLLHTAPVFAAYRLPVSRMFARCHRHTRQQRTGYNSASRLIRTRHIPDARIMCPRFCADACSFVRPCLRRPAYVSYRRFASYFTAGEGRCPFEPRKNQRRGKR